MNPISFIYQEVLYRPLFNLLVGVTAILPTHSVGVGIIIVTFLTRLLLLPSAIHQARQLHRNQAKMAQVQKELKGIQEKHKDNQAKRAEATMALYREAGINPASGCLPLLIQFPVLIALYRVFLTGLGPETYQHLYSFVSVPTQLNSVFFGVNLSVPSLYLALLAGVAQFVQMRFFMPTPAPSPGLQENSEQMMAAMQRNMMYIFPVMTVFIGLKLPAALALYWFVGTVLAIGQQYIMKKALKLNTNPPSL